MRTDKQLQQALAEIRSTNRSAGDPLIEDLEKLIAGEERLRDHVELCLDALDRDAR